MSSTTMSSAVANWHNAFTRLSEWLEADRDRHKAVILADERANPQQREAAILAIHLAGVNRPASVDDFAAVNLGMTERICTTLTRLDRRPVIVFASSSQAGLDNPYGLSKRRAEDALRDRELGGRALDVEEVCRHREQRDAEHVISAQQDARTSAATVYPA